MNKPEGSLISYFSRKAIETRGINLAQGKPGFDPPAELTDILSRLIKDSTLHQYAPGNGRFELLSLLSGKYGMEENRLLVTQGATEGIFLSFYYLSSIIKEQFSILSFNPVYESYFKLPETPGTPFISFDFKDNLEVDFELLKEIIKIEKVKIIFISSPGNPLGKIWNKEELAKMVQMAEELDFYLVFDAVYQDLCYTSEFYNPLELNSNRLFYINSFSKMLSITGWRIGYMITSEEHMRKIRAIHDYTGLSAPSLFQQAITEYLQNYNYGADYIRDVKDKCRANMEILGEVFRQRGFSLPSQDGGYFIWAGLPDKFSDGFEFASELVEKAGVAVVPGENFSEISNNFIRVNIALPEEKIREAGRRISEFLK